MIKIGSSYIRKFQFFEEIDQKILKNNKIENEEKPIDDSEININNLIITSPKQMKIFENNIFIIGQAKHKRKGQMVRENLVMKADNNKIINEYFIFNLIYYDFIIRVFNDKPYFIFLGSSYCQKPQKEGIVLFTETKIKIYDGNLFLKDEKNGNIKGYEKGNESFPKYLKNEIKLFKRLDDDKLITDEAEENLKSLEALQNINAFDISENFLYAAVSIDKGGIILIYGFPNLLECQNKNIKVKYLPLITYKEKEVDVTNIQFSNVSKTENFESIILYVVTGNSIYYYQWDYEPEKNYFPKNPIIKTFIQDKLGAYNSRIQVRDSYLLVGNDKMIGEYNNLLLEQTWFFEGKKTIVNYFNDYIYFVIFGEEEHSFQIFDKKNKFFLYQKTSKNKILSVCNDNKFICIFYEETPEKKYIIKLKEKNNKEKFETFFNKKYFDDALMYAKNLGFNDEQMSEISIKNAQYEFSKGHYDRAIDEYIKTIKYYEPSIIVQKFLEKSKFNYLIKYLETIVEGYSSKDINLEESKNYTTLLLHCYIIQEEINKLKDFIEKKGQIFSNDLLKVVIEVCVETDNPDIGLSIAKEHNMINEYIFILLTKLNEYDEAIEILETPEKLEFKITNKERVELYLKFSDYFLLDKKKEEEINEEKDEENISDKFFDSVIKFIENNKKDLEKNDIIKLIEKFLDSDKYFKSLFEFMNSYNLTYSKEMIHRRIQLYLEDLNIANKKEEAKSKIISILKNEKYMQIYDIQYLLMLFKTNHFLEGTETILELNKFIQDLLSIYIQKNDFQKIINLCKNFGSKELSFWGTSLNYFLSKDLRKIMTKEEIKNLNKYFEEFLNELLNSKIMPAIDVLDMINEQNCDIEFNVINKFLNNALNNELDSIENKKNIYNDYESEIKNICENIKELKTKASVFNPNKCCVCSSDIEIPYFSFFCGHSMHKSCLNLNSKEDIIECPKCKDEKKAAFDDIQKLKKYERHLTSLEKLENVLERKENKIDFIYELYGKGLFNFENINQGKK